MMRMRSPLKRGAAVAADAVLAASAPWLIRRRTGGASGAPRVLVVRCDHIGDAVMATAVLEPLRAALRPSRMDVLVGPWAAPLFAGHALVDEVIVYATPWWIAARGGGFRQRLEAWSQLPGVIRRLRQTRYDIGIDLRGDLRHIVFFLALGGCADRVSTDRTGGRSLLTHIWSHDASLHEVEKNAAVAGLVGATGLPTLAAPISSALVPALEQELQAAAGPRGFVVLALHGTEPKRSWPAGEAARLAIAARSQLGLGAVYAGGSSDRASGEAIAAAGASILNLAGRTSLLETLAVMTRAAAVVAIDSGPAHLGALSGAPVLALFGPGDPHLCRPWTARAGIATTGAPCGCIHPWCDKQAGAGRCMSSLSAEAVLTELKLLLQGSGPVL